MNMPHKRFSSAKEKETIKSKGKRFLKAIQNACHPSSSKKKPSKLRSWLSFSSKSELTWCFRKVPDPLTNTDTVQELWTRFEQENEQFLTKEYHVNPLGSVEIQDRGILSGSAAVQIVLSEGIAFAVNPESSEPVCFEIVSYPSNFWVWSWNSKQQTISRLSKRKI
ncbi:hypothetical protein BY458DRAFT_492513 [Sporodiniella umbellata]|nr:hypothetical protein BY458DRAFT_492513 [Sporodiniella umbellata]